MLNDLLSTLIARWKDNAPVKGQKYNEARNAAVLILFGGTGPDKDGHILFLQRSLELRHHPGQIAFPGGSQENFESPPETALREAQEETALNPKDVTVLGSGPAQYVWVSNFSVTPVIGVSPDLPAVHAVDPGETADVFYLEVKKLLDPCHRKTAYIIDKTEQGNVRYDAGPAFCVDNKVVWGFTAHLLDHIFDQVGLTIPWDVSQEIDIEV